MNKDPYTIEELERIFDSHVAKCIEERENTLKKFKEYNPDQEIPDYLQDDFNFPMALKIICSEIIKLKEINGIFH